MIAYFFKLFMILRDDLEDDLYFIGMMAVRYLNKSLVISYLGFLRSKIYFFAAFVRSLLGCNLI